MIGDHHGRRAGRATLLVRAVGDILGTHRSGRHCLGSGRAGPASRRMVPSPAGSARVILRGRLIGMTEAERHHIEAATRPDIGHTRPKGYLGRRTPPLPPGIRARAGTGGRMTCRRLTPTEIEWAGAA